MIPKIFHQAWLGSAPLPDEVPQWQATWKRYHPGWEIRLWTDDNIPLLQNVREFDQAPSPAAKANILRYELLLRFGGVWLDVDMECLKPVDSLLKNVEAFVARRNSSDLCIAVMGSKPQHPFFQALVDGLPAHYAAHSGQGPVMSCGGRYVQSLLASIDNSIARQVTQYPAPTFFPYDFPDRALAWRKERRAVRHSYAIHYYLHTWAPRSETKE